MALKDDISKYVADKFPAQETVIDNSMIDVEASRSAPKIEAPDTFARAASPKNADTSVIPKYADINPFAAENNGFYSTMHRQMFGEDAPETPEEKTAREKRERARASIAALSDGLASIANIWGASQGATPMNLASLSQANRKRYEYADNLRRQNEAAWKHGLMQARIGDMNLRRHDEAAKAQAARWKQEQEYKRLKDERDFLTKQRKEAREIAQQQFDNELAVRKYNETVNNNRTRNAILGRNAILKENKTGKMAQFSVGWGNTVDVPEADKYLFATDVFRQMVENSGGKENSPVLKFVQYQYGTDTPSAAQMMNAIAYHIEDFPEIQGYMQEQARRYRDGTPNTINYTTPAQGVKADASVKAGALAITPKAKPTPGSPAQASVPITKGAAYPNQSEADEISNLVGLPIPENIIGQYGIYPTLSKEATGKYLDQKFGTNFVKKEEKKPDPKIAKAGEASMKRGGMINESK